eukprot:TRINITY_DN3550_c0_g1_i3.p1 TRINITY_DN3550_c0_g1~~TRINITY_DN3550_c0_g1_i3.p1  ORF type:complete len:195 (-),score=30.64 TRINITY_DN3550_c0_g1_i3:61-645(-)
MVSHWQLTRDSDPAQEGHCLAASLSDLSVWCYVCDSYIKHDSLQQLLVKMEVLKFGDSSLQNILLLPPPVFGTGFVYDVRMNLHRLTTGKHYERPERVEVAYQQLAEVGLLSKVRAVRARLATVNELGLVHTMTHINRVKETVTSNSTSSDFPEDCYTNQHTYMAARLSCGGVTDLTLHVAKVKKFNLCSSQFP